MKNKMIAAFLLTVVFLVSCKPTPVDVVIDQAMSDSVPRKISVDGKTIFKLTGDSTIVVKLTPGEHFVQINDSAKRNFTVTEKGGILNLDDQEYAVFDLKYKVVGGYDLNVTPWENAPVRSPVLIDSFIIFPAAGKLSSSDSALRELLPGIIEKKKHPEKDSNYYASLRLTGKGSFYIAKDWDYNMTDSIPETITVERSDISGSTKTTILQSRIFLLGLLFSPDQKEYTVKSVSDIREGANDKNTAKEDKDESSEKAKENKKKEMDF